MITSRSTRATAASSSSSRRSNRWKYELCKNPLLLFFFLFSFSLFLKSVYTSSSAYANRWKYDVFQIFGGLLLQNNNQITGVLNLLCSHIFQRSKRIIRSFTGESWERFVFFTLKRSGVALLYLISMIISRSTRTTAASLSSSRRSNRWKYELCKNPPLLFFFLFSSSLFLRSVYTSSSAYANRWKYDVFLSFRGDDTRTTFTDHLYIALRNADIYTFVDYQLRGGSGKIQSELDREIERSRIAVVIFSKRYAESRWCLRELSKIMRCREDQEGKVVYPIFYDVDPSEVRKQRGSFGEAFQKHEREEDPDEVEQWRKDLKACADLIGRNLKTTADGREGLFIQKVVGDIIRLTKTRDLQTRQALGWNTLLRLQQFTIFIILFYFIFLKSVNTSSSAQVFLSFRGEDTRTGFTDHLSIALRNGNINTYVGVQLTRGENILSELDREIKGSRIAVVIFSKRYAESRWCLRELSNIMRCRQDQEGKVVYPIFYDVDPSQMRKQSGSFGEAFRMHEERDDPNEVEQWRKDLKACAELSGRDLKTTADGREGLFIQNVAGDIIGLTKTTGLQTCQALGWNPMSHLQQFTIFILFFFVFFIERPHPLNCDCFPIV